MFCPVLFPRQSFFQPFAWKFNAKTAEKHVMFLAAFTYLTAVTPHFNALAAIFVTAFTFLVLKMLTACTISAAGSYIIKVHNHFFFYYCTILSVNKILFLIRYRFGIGKVKFRNAVIDKIVKVVLNVGKLKRIAVFV